MIVFSVHRLRAISLMILLMGGCSAAPPFPPATPQAVISVSNLISPAVVRIDVAQEVYVDGKRTLRRGLGRVSSSIRAGGC